MAKTKHDPHPTPAAGVGPSVQTVEITVTHPDTKTETVEVELPAGDRLIDKRLVVALVGLNHSGGAVGPQEVVLDVPAAGVAELSFAVS